MISVIMPAYNAERYIEMSIQSVFSQTFQDWELIIVDDCSTDCTPHIVKTLLHSNKSIQYYKNSSNLGAAESRNHGVAMASGDWIAFLDSDDCWHPDKLKLQLEFAMQNHADFVFTGSAFMDEKGTLLDYYLPAPSMVNYRSLLKQNVISCSSVLIRRGLVQQYPMKGDDKIHEDFAVWLQILRDKKITAYGINLPLLIYRVSPKSKSGNKAKAGLMTYRVYRSLGIATIPALFYWLHYCIRSLKKYCHLIGKLNL